MTDTLDELPEYGRKVAADSLVGYWAVTWSEQLIHPLNGPRIPLTRWQSIKRRVAGWRWRIEDGLEAARWKLADKIERLAGRLRY